MRKPEQRLWDNMRNALRFEFYLERMENLVGTGRPDVDVMYNGIVIPVELKAATYPARPTTPVLGKAAGLNCNQLNWWLSWCKAGGRGIIIVRLDKDLYAVPSAMSEIINEFTSRDFREHTTDWPRIIESIKINVKRICTQNR